MIMIRRLFPLVLFFSVFSLHAQFTSDPLCGHRSLQVVFQKLGVKSSLEEVSRLSGYKEKEGTTMLGLYQAARKKGLYAEGVKISLDDISSLKTPVIAYLWDNHFLVVEGDGTDTLIITDFPKEPQLTPKDKFQPFYSGFALVVSRDKIFLPNSETKEADIRFDNYTYDFGKIESGQKIEHTFTFKNTGDQKLTISNVRTTCGCTTAVILSDKNVPPKGKGEIKVIFDTTGRSGLQTQKIYIQSNDPITFLVPLQIQGVIDEPGLTISPRSIVFGNIKKGTTVIREIIGKTGENVKVTKVESYPSFLSATLSPITDKPYQGSKVTVSLSPDTPLCNLEGKVTIYTTDKKHPKVEIPVTANIIGDVELYPSMLFFGVIKQGETPTTKITISTTGNTPLKIEKVESNLPFLSTNLTPTQEGKKYTLSATLTKNTPEGNIKNTVTLYTNNPDQPEIKIPVYGIVE